MVFNEVRPHPSAIIGEEYEDRAGLTTSTMNATQDLVALGFTEIEAKAYCELLKSGPLTGYALACAIDRAPSNIYQTLESLRRKGAILSDQAEPRTFRAVEASELLSNLERGFKQRKQGALQRLHNIGRHGPDDRFYNLKSVEQVYARARAMLADAKEVVLFDLFPGPFGMLADALADAARRGVIVGGIGYGETPVVRGVQTWAHPWQSVENSWPGQQLTIIRDAAECLIALIARSGEEVRHAMWTDSVYLSCLHHGGLACEIQVAAKKRESGDPIVKLGLLTKPPMGLRTLISEASTPPRQRRRVTKQTRNR